MALPSALAGPWNPLRVTGTNMPPALVLMCKIIAVAILFTDHRRQLQEPFLPFAGFLDLFREFPHYLPVLRIIFVGSALALLFNRNARMSAFVLGSCFLLAVLSSRTYYGNNKTLCGLLLVLASLTDRDQQPWLIRWQFALLYFGAALNKILDPDWQSGLFFEHWAGSVLKSSAFSYVAGLLPPLLAGLIISWTTIAVEFFLALGALLPRLFPAVVWINILFQVALLQFTGDTFNLFFYAALASSWAFIEWPREKMLDLYDGDCGFCNFSRLQIERVDFDNLHNFQPYQLGDGRKFGIRDEDCQKALYLVDRGRILSGFAAFRWMMLYSAPFWLTLTAVIAQLAFWGWTLALRIIVGLVLLFFLPLFRPVGEWTYQWIARNRHRLMPGATCGLEQGPQKKA